MPFHELRLCLCSGLEWCEKERGRTGGVGGVGGKWCFRVWHGLTEGLEARVSLMGVVHERGA